jgi:hypothetical protein
MVEQEKDEVWETLSEIVREYPVMLKEAPIQPQESRYIIMPRKLRKRLAIDKGSTVEVKA